MIEPTAWGAPVAEVWQAFDEEAALARVKELIGRRDDAQGEKQDAILKIGQEFIEMRRRFPGEMVKGMERYSPRFLAFIEKTGLVKETARHYMCYARDPKKLELHRARDRGTKATYATRGRTKVLAEIRDALLDSTREEVLAAINLELAGTFPNVQANA